MFPQIATYDSKYTNKLSIKKIKKMKKNAIILFAIAFSGFAFSQVGISTSNPQGTFHVDGAKDNPATGTPTAAQSLNDMVITSTGNVGVGTVAPAAKVDIIGDTFGVRRAQGSGSWDNIWFDISNTSAPSINASGAETGLQFKVGANAVGTYGDGQTLVTAATIRPNGDVGIGVVPTSKLDVNGETRIRTINSVVGTTADNIVVADANGILKIANDLPRRSVYNTAAIAPTASETITVTDPNFNFAQINIVAGNVCARTMIATFSKYGNTISYLGGQARNSIGQYTLLDANGNNLSVVFPGVVACADGGNGTQFDFDILISGNNITITNRGNINKAYSVRIISNL